ncbi:hypothetical protein BX592_111134 [Paraburkholderia rhizosphaerae]|uniref:Uncharacterized protein n=1 Tax=Paraburkholderia rhizosphaerae TaxID=480658 RepID=A0A4V6QD27_9BURK|nr:hypothetical protein BX592_111134 [Paraburkholderia rhizosphaerae]
MVQNGQCTLSVACDAHLVTVTFQRQLQRREILGIVINQQNIRHIRLKEVLVRGRAMGRSCSYCPCAGHNTFPQSTCRNLGTSLLFVRRGNHAAHVLTKPPCGYLNPNISQQLSANERLVKRCGFNPSMQHT